MTASMLCPVCGEQADYDVDADEDYYADDPCDLCAEEALAEAGDD